MDIYNWIMELITNLSMASIAFNCFLIVVESIIPPLPLSLFITVFFVNYGPIIGLILSWIFTVIGCIMSYYLFKTILKKYVDKIIDNNEFCNNFLKIVNKISFSKLVLIIAMPFTPAFAVNIVCGISNMNIKKYISAIIIGKIFMIIFWGYIGTNLIESFKNPIIIIKILVLLLLSYVLSKIINKKLKLD